MTLGRTLWLVPALACSSCGAAHVADTGPDAEPQTAKDLPRVPEEAAVGDASAPVFAPEETPAPLVCRGSFLRMSALDRCVCDGGEIAGEPCRWDGGPWQPPEGLRVSFATEREQMKPGEGTRVALIIANDTPTEQLVLLSPMPASRTLVARDEKGNRVDGLRNPTCPIPAGTLGMGGPAEVVLEAGGRIIEEWLWRASIPQLVPDHKAGGCQEIPGPPLAPDRFTLFVNAPLWGDEGKLTVTVEVSEDGER